MKIAAALAIANINGDLIRHARSNEEDRDIEDPYISRDYPIDYHLIEQVQKVQSVIDDGGARGRSGNAGGGVRHFKSRKFLINSQLAQSGHFYYQLHEYGCYCVASEEKGKGKGTPVDEFDHACKRHSQCYQCVFSDFACNPKSSGYKYKITKSNGHNEITCLNQDNTCQRSACECDKNLAVELGQIAMENGIEKEFEDYDGAKCVKKPKTPMNALFIGNTSGGGSTSGGSGGAGGGSGGAGGFVGESFASDDEGEIQMSAIRDSGFEEMSAVSLATETGFEEISHFAGFGSPSVGSSNRCCGNYPRRYTYSPTTHECCNGDIQAIGTC